jgi:hypothetical protein
LLADVSIPMPDGVRLSADVYTPAKSGRYPAIVQFSAYSRDLHTTGMPKGTAEIGSPSIIADRGYIQVVVTARGVGRSEGTLRPWHCAPEIDDYVRCVEWAAEQPWCSGDVCLFGTSYYGMNQAAVAARKPPMLKAFFANEICTDFRRHVWRYGGMFNAGFVSLWAGANFTEREVKRYVPPIVRALMSHVLNRPWVWRLMRGRIDAIMAAFKERTPVPEALETYVAMLSDTGDRLSPPLWDGPARQLSGVDVPFVVVQNRGLIALHQFGSYDLFANAGTPRDRRWLIIGPAEYELPVLSWQLEALAFFDCIVKGVDNGYERQPRVRYWRDGAEEWSSAGDFPPPESERVRLYLENGALSRVIPAEATAEWLSVPRGADVLPGIDRVKPQVLRLAWNADRDLDLLGPVSITLRYSCNEIDSYIVARLDRIASNGERRCLAMGHLRPARRRVIEGEGSPAEIVHDSRALDPLEPGAAVDLRFSLTPAAALVRAGERLELSIASRTDLLPLRVRDGFVAPDMPVPPFFALNTLYFGEGTFLEVTAMPARDVPASSS